MLVNLFVYILFPINLVIYELMNVCVFFFLSIAASNEGVRITDERNERNEHWNSSQQFAARITGRKSASEQPFLQSTSAARLRRDGIHRIFS